MRLSRSEGRLILTLAAIAMLITGLELLPRPSGASLMHLKEGSMTGEPQILDLNRASLAELIELPGIGPLLAERIVRYRLMQGPFRAIEELLRVPGIGPQTLEKLRPYVRICPSMSCD